MLNYIEKIEAKLEKTNKNLKLFWRCDSMKVLLILNATLAHNMALLKT